MKITSTEGRLKQEAKRLARQESSRAIKEYRRTKRASDEDRAARKKHREPLLPIVNVQPVVVERTADQLRNDLKKSKAKLALRPLRGRTLRRQQEREFVKQMRAIEKANKEQK